MTDQELRETAKKFRRINNQVKNLSQDQGILRRRILDEMEARQVKETRIGSTRIVVTDVTAMRIDTGRLWEEAPALAQMYAVSSATQRLTVT